MESLLPPRRIPPHGESDSRVGEDKQTIKGRTPPQTILSYFTLVFIQISVLNSAKIVLVFVNIVFNTVVVNFVKCKSFYPKP